MTRSKELPEFCFHCEARMVDSYLDNYGRRVCTMACGSMWLELGPLQAMPVKSCSVNLKALEWVKEWVDTQR